ncbi:delta(1)-pyrroline-2-carboxylate reductase family protein [Noviherbaspirillum aridicola]|uniref:Ornithine cyclodeaminase n=1 Tax=Noviherbaspirillum aridicola TaxID=2849687 RepID=A0ABQ4Q4N8_9BURK|nr:delta(1)-pyrroline-2-carboxylate reductase family protein [Noviherbaspirillum aridicola]GIZ52022.1 ornithine cyclodeaminase [Noviherbaspirillum aridicola]
MKILDQASTAAALPYDRLVPALARACRELVDGTIRAPERQVVPIDAASVLLSMPAIGADISATKLITVHGENARHGLPAIQGEVIVFDTATGRRLALLDGPTVTARRTAAMTLLGIDTLAARKPASALLIGTGTQSRAHVEALAGFFGIEDFRIAGRSMESAARFCQALRVSHPGARFSPLSVEDIGEAPDVDLVIALTTARSPVVPAVLAAHTLAVGVGAFKREMAELPPQLLRSRAIVVDDAPGARHEAGDLIQAGVDWSAVAPIGAILSGKAPRPAGPAVFKTVGQAAWDLAAARVALGSAG